MHVKTFDSMIGKTLTSVVLEETHKETMTFTAADGHVWRFFHNQSCCESVFVEDVCGDLSDLGGTPILVAEQVSNVNNPPKDPDTSDDFEWTFYKFATLKGAVTVRWLGTTDSCYSVDVKVEETVPKLESESKN